MSPEQESEEAAGGEEEREQADAEGREREERERLAGGEDEEDEEAGEESGERPAEQAELGEMEEEAGREPLETAESGEAGEGEDEPADAEASRSVDRVDQMGQAADEDAQDDRVTPGFGEEASPGEQGNMPAEWIVEQWLERIESDPARLLRSQFVIEERREWERQGGMFVEPRPW